MLFLILLPILVSGYILFSYHPKRFFSIHRYDGQLLYLTSAFNGLICTILSFLSIALMKKYMPESISLPLDKYMNDLIIEIVKDQSTNITWILLGSLNALFIAYIWTMFAKLKWMLKTVGVKNIFNYVKNLATAIYHKKDFPKIEKQTINLKTRTKILLMAAHVKYSPMLTLYMESFVGGGLIMFTLGDRKVYVGRVISMGEPTETSGLDQEITITPFLSGYREKDTLTINFTTIYKEIDEDLYLTIRQENIVTATKYIQSFIGKIK